MLDAVGCTLLVTGGAGYIGSHTAFALASAGHRVVVLDNLDNGHVAAVHAAAALSGRTIAMVEGDIRSTADLQRAWQQGPFDAVLHFAALKSVDESIREPQRYEEVNVGGTEQLCEAMLRHKCRRLVFSSSAAVYGDGDDGTCSEDSELRPLSPYGRTKGQAEEVVESYARQHGWSAISLRYFNPVGAHPSGEMGEDPLIRANLAPVLLDVAAGLREELHIFGDDYPTEDGTCIRDYIHIMDLASAHLSALDKSASATGHLVYNVGTGRGSSVLEVLKAARRVTGQAIAARVVARREGDCAALVANISRAEEELGWAAQHTVTQMLESAWSWRRQHPQGYSGS
jgi:UDP-glucose 4-epimerase